MSSAFSTSTALVAALGEAQYQLSIAEQESVRLNAEVQSLRIRTNNKKKMTSLDVRQLRAMAATGRFTQRELADYFQINSGTVSRIVNRVYYSEVS